METNRMRVHAEQSHENQCTSWSVQSMMVNAYIHGLDDEPRTVSRVNLVDYLGKTKQGQWGSAKGRKFYLADYSDDSTHYRNNTLLPGLNEVCRPSGFALVSDGYRKDTFSLSLLCTKGLVYQDNAKTKTISNDGCRVEGRDGSTSRDGSVASGFATSNGAQVRKRRKTCRPLRRKDRCRFRFQLFWDGKHRLWYFYEFSAGIVQHNGHCQLRPEEVRVSSRKATNVESMDASDATIRTTEILMDEGHAVDFPAGDDWSPPDEPGNAELDDDGTDIVPPLQINFARTTAREKERIQERLEADQVYDSLLPAFERMCRRVTSVDTYHMLEQTLLGLEAKIDAMSSTATGNEARVQCPSESDGCIYRDPTARQ